MDSNTIQQIIIAAPPILLSITVHEYSHGAVANKLGDPTAKDAGRLTLNPLKHLDLVGTLVFFITRMIGWAKPVPVNPYNLGNPKRDMMWVSLAGPTSNLFLALVSALIYHLIKSMGIAGLIPIKILMPIFIMVQISVTINIALAIFNLIPIPPLDGSKILMGMLSHEQAAAYAKIEPYGFIILLALIMTNVFEIVFFPIINLFIKLLLGTL